MSLFVGKISRSVTFRMLADELDKFGRCKINLRVSKTNKNLLKVGGWFDRDRMHLLIIMMKSQLRMQ